VLSFARTVAAGKTARIYSKEIRQKRTQTNPLRLSLSESAGYAIFEKNEPIEVKCQCFNCLGRKKGRFLKNMDENASITSPDSKNSGKWPVAGGKRADQKADERSRNVIDNKDDLRHGCLHYSRFDGAENRNWKIETRETSTYAGPWRRRGSRLPFELSRPGASG